MRRSGRVQMLKLLPAIQTFHQLKTFSKSWNEKHNKGDPELLEKKTFVKTTWIRCWVYEIYKWLDSVCICILQSNPTFSALGLYINRFICTSLACLSQTTNVAFIPSFFVMEFNGEMLWACFRDSVMFAQSCLWRLHALMSNTSNRSPATYPHFNAT